MYDAERPIRHRVATQGHERNSHNMWHAMNVRLRVLSFLQRQHETRALDIEMRRVKGTLRGLDPTLTRPRKKFRDPTRSRRCLDFTPRRSSLLDGSDSFSFPSLSYTYKRSLTHSDLNIIFPNKIHLPVFRFPSITHSLVRQQWAKQAPPSSSSTAFWAAPPAS
jgi:hypothetical protein